jgi:ABC-type nitrate/sulfonate/bicarbonate transport system ATPase subunit
VIRVAGLSKAFATPAGGRLVVLDGVSFAVEPGAFLTILGPSGSGKSLLLQLIAGLERPTGGSIRIGDGGAGGPRIGFVFQSPRLLPWKRAADQIRYVLAGRRLPRAEETRVVDGVLALTGLAPYARYYPHQLSGGMQQRLAIARALAYDADVILMDEPFSSVDEITAGGLRQELARLWTETGKTILFVTHDIAEACFLGSEVLILTPKPTRIHVRLPVPLARPRVAGSDELFEQERAVRRAFERAVATGAAAGARPAVPPDEAEHGRARPARPARPGAEGPRTGDPPEGER